MEELDAFTDTDLEQELYERNRQRLKERVECRFVVVDSGGHTAGPDFDTYEQAEDRVAEVLNHRNTAAVRIEKRYSLRPLGLSR